MTICEHLAVACACATECVRTNLPSASSTQSSRPASWSPAGGFPRFQISRKLGIYNFANFDLAYLDDLWRRVRCPERAGDTRTTHAHARRSAYEPSSTNLPVPSVNSTQRPGPPAGAWEADFRDSRLEVFRMKLQAELSYCHDNYCTSRSMS